MMKILDGILSKSTNTHIDSFLTASVAGNSIGNYLIAGLIVLSSYFLGFIAKKLLCGKLAQLAAKTETKADDFIIETIKKPIVLIFLNTGLFMALKYLVFPIGIENVLFGLIHTFYIVLFTWFAIKFVDFLVEVYLIPKTQQEDSTIDDHLPPFLKNASRILAFVIAFILILTTFGFDVKNIWAGLGIGGIAVAFAAQDLLANLFGGISIMFDKPFRIGQRVKINGVDGEVTQIRIRTTRIKTLDGSMVVIPNRKFSENHIENITKATERKVTLELGVAYNTKNNNVKKAIEIVEKTILEHEKTKKECYVYFDDFGESALKISATYWIPKGYQLFPMFAKAKNEINLRIKEEFEKAGIEFAYPTQTLYVKKE
jgi:MscS family membrane protein